MFEKLYETLNALPVSAVAQQVVESVKDGKVSILAAPTGSGKSMMVPAKLADELDERVVVLVPRRFLATDAASNIAQMTGTEVGQDVGYLIGRTAGDRPRYSDHTKLLFVTYGYAIQSGLINKAKNIVLDEVHEGSEDISLARAILHERKKQDGDLRLLEMSATVDAQKQSAYWSGVADTSIHSVEGQTLACEERRETPGRDSESVAQTAIRLLRDEGRNGIAIFRPGIKDVEKTVEELQEGLKSAGLGAVEVAQIYGGTPADERALARMAPAPGGKKIIVGTNVIESGVNLRWVDAGISDGFGKIPYDRPDTGAAALVQEDLPQWRIVQQRGRINRAPDATGFDEGIFILHSNREMEHRPQQATPELERRSLMNVAFWAAQLGYDPEELHFDANLPTGRLQEAKADLMRLGLIDEWWGLTQDGKYAAKLPLAPQAAAIVCEAHRMDIAAARSGEQKQKNRPKLLNDAIIMAAIIEQGGLRKDYRRGHGLEGKSDIHGPSDIIDGLKAYLRLEASSSAKMVAHSADIIAQGDESTLQTLRSARERLKKQCEELNVDVTDFTEVMLLVGEVRSRIKDQKALQASDAEFDPARYNELKRTILNGNAHRLFVTDVESGERQPTYRDLLRDYGNKKNDRGEPFNGYGVNRNSTLSGAQKTSLTPFVVGSLREMPARNGGPNAGPETVIDQVTSIPTDVFISWAAAHDPSVLDQVAYASENQKGTLSGRYDGRASFTIPVLKPSPEIQQDISQLVHGQPDKWAAQISGNDSAGYRGR